MSVVCRSMRFSGIFWLPTLFRGLQRKFVCMNLALSAARRWSGLGLAALILVGGPFGAPRAEAQAVTFTPTSLSFAAAVGSSESQSVVISNSGTAPLAISAVSITGTNANQFSFTNLSCTGSLSPGTGCVVSVVFSPTSLGIFTAALSVTDNATGSPQSLPLTGDGNPVTTTVSVTPSGPLSFTSLVNSFSASQSITLTNTGNSELTVSSSTLTGPDANAFTGGATCINVYPGSVCGANLVFVPTAAGTYNATLTITDNSTTSPHIISLTGVAGYATGLYAHPSPPAVVVGSGFSQPYGIAVDGLGDLFVTDSANNLVKEIVAVNGQVSATSAVIPIGSGFKNPLRVAVDTNGDVFVADTGNNAIKEIIAVNGLVSAASTVITVGSGFNSPSGVAVDLSGNVYVADTGNNAVKEIVAVNGLVSASSTVTALGSGFLAPADVAVDGNGEVYVADLGNRAVKVITPENSSIDLYTLPGTFTAPVAVAVNQSGSIFVVDKAVNEVLEIRVDYATSVAAGWLPAEITRVSGLNLPTGIAADNAGNVFVADQGNGATKQFPDAALDVGATNVGTSATVLVPFTFDTGGMLGSWQVYTQGSTGLDFTVSATGTTCSTSTTYAAGNTCSVSVQFAPRYTGWRIGAVQLLDTSGSIVATANLEGIGVAPQIVFPSNAARYTAGSGSQLEAPVSAFVTTSGDIFVQDKFLGVLKISAVNGMVAPNSATTKVGGGNSGQVTVDGAGDVFWSLVGGNDSLPPVYEIQAVNGQVSLNSPLVGGVTYSPPYLSGGLHDASGDLFSIPNASLIQVNPLETLAVNGHVLSTSTVVTAASNFFQAVNLSLDGAGNLYVVDFGNYVGSPGSPQVYVYPFATAPTVTFPTGTAVGTTDTADGPMTVTVANNGNQPLVFPVPATGVNPSINANFLWAGTSTCQQVSAGSTSPFTLAPGARCNINIEFAPSVTGTINGTVVITDNALNATAPSYTTQTVNLTGIGGVTTPTVTITPSVPLSFLAQVGSTSFAQTATVTNSGSEIANIGNITIGGANPSDFAIVTNTCGGALAIGASCTISITFTPPSLGSFSATLSIADNATGSPQTVTLTGTGSSTPAPGVYLTPATLNFSAAVGNNSTQTLTLSNYLSTAISNIGFGYSNTAFTYIFSGCPTTLNSGASCTIPVTFTPSAATSYTGTFTVTEVGNSLPQIVTLNGIGTTATGPPVTLTPGSLTFTSTVGTPSAAQTVTVTNTSSTALTFSGSSILGLGFADFADTTTCGTTLNAGASCTILVTFTPTATTGYSATLLVAEVGITQAQTVTLTGTGTATTSPVVSVSPATFNLSATVGATSAQTMYVQNSGTVAANITGVTIGGANPSDFSITNNCGSTLSAGAECSIYVYFTPVSVGSFSASIFVADNATGSPQTVTLTGTGIAALPALSLTPATLSFSGTVGATPTLQTATLTNTGNITLNITNVAISGAGFSIAATNCGGSLNAGANCATLVEFTPTAATSYAGTLTVTDNLTGSVHTVTLVGTGIGAAAPAVSLTPSALTFTSTVGTPSTAQMATLSNTGNATLNITSIATGGAFTDTTGCGSTLAAGASCTILVTFTPTAATSYTGTLTVTDSATGSPHAVALAGTGTIASAPVVSLTPGSLTFSSVSGTASAAQIVSLQNTGNAPLSIGSIVIGGSNASVFTDTSACGSTLNAGSSCLIMVIFTPISVASYSAALTVTDNGNGSPQTAALIGTGTTTAVPIAGLSPNPLAFPSTAVGLTATALPVTLSNTGTATLTGIAATLTGTNPSDFAITSAGTCGATLAAGSSCTIYISFTPATAIAFTAMLSVADNASGSPQTVALTGTGIAASSDFGISSIQPIQNIQPGSVAQYSITVFALSGFYNSPVTLSVSGLPAGATASFNPSTLTPGNTSATSVLSIKTASLIGANSIPRRPQYSGGMDLLVALCMLPLLGIRRIFKLSAALPRLSMLLLLGALALVPLLGLTGCSGGFYGPTVQNYTVTVTGISGATQHSTNVTLTVQ
jgi:hypothetical protein